nr:hypothetical protein [Tanacetum cinerariifolium]
MLHLITLESTKKQNPLKDQAYKGSNNEGEAPDERISIDSEEIARVLTSMDAATVLAGEANVPTDSGFIPTAGPPATIVSTSSEKVHSEGERNYWQIIRLGGSSACFQFSVDLLRQLDREDLNQLWALVKEYLSIKP